jgi:transposase-like protein
MPVREEYTAGFKEQAVSSSSKRSARTSRTRQRWSDLARGSIKRATFMNWVKAAAPAARQTPPVGSEEELRAQNGALRKENRELTRANEILQAAASFFGTALDRQCRQHGLDATGDDLRRRPYFVEPSDQVRRRLTPRRQRATRCGGSGHWAA